MSSVLGGAGARSHDIIHVALVARARSNPVRVGNGMSRCLCVQGSRASHQSMSVMALVVGCGCPQCPGVGLGALALAGATELDAQAEYATLLVQCISVEGSSQPSRKAGLCSPPLRTRS